MTGDCLFRKRPLFFRLALLLLASNNLNAVAAFPLPLLTTTPPSSSSTLLFGINEWRSSSLDSTTPSSNTNRTILLLPMLLTDPEEAAPLIPGQTKTFPLTKESPTELLQEAIQKQSSILGGLLIQEDGTVMPVFPLLEIIKYEVEEATIALKCVGRAKLAVTTIQQRKEDFLEGFCQELPDLAQEQDDCEEVVQDMEQLLSSESQTARNAAYQEAFWKALPALGYNPTALLTRDPVSSNSQKELEAASWAGLAACLQDPQQRYQAFATESTLERLQWVRRSLLTTSLLLGSDDTDTLEATDRNEDNDLGVFE